MIKACLSQGVRRMVHFSSIHAFDQSPLSQSLDEGRAPVKTPCPPYDRSEAAGEEAVKKGVRRSGLNAVIINPTAIVGPSDYRPSHFGQVILSLARQQLPALVAGGFDRVDVHDVVQGDMQAELPGFSFQMGRTLCPPGFYLSFHAAPTGGKIPLLIVSFGLIFNTVNAYLNSRYLFYLADGYADSWLFDWRFVVGLTLFITGFAINRHPDHLFRKLRGICAEGYEMPCGGLFRWVSSPNYLGEIMLWSGWMLATWSLPGLAFAIWTVANPAPRTRQSPLV